MKRRQQRLNRRRFIRGVAWGTLGFCTAGAVDAWGIEPEWVEVTEWELNLKNLPRPFVGCRLVHISDLHCSATVSEEYLRRCVQRVNQLQPDMVFLTGDYVTHDRKGYYRKQVVKLIGGVRSRLGVFACLGNHDYSIASALGRRRDEHLHYLESALQAKGVCLLRNQSHTVMLDNTTIQIVGLGDFWANDFDPRRAFARVHKDIPSLVLSHNPDSIDTLLAYQPDVVFSGHTHGGQVRIPFFGPPIVPLKNRHFSAGMFTVDNTRLYVNRGLGRIGRIRFNCRPEITCFTLTS